MARKEEAGLIEQHVEKIAIGIALVILVVVGLHWGLESPRRIKLGINAIGMRQTVERTFQTTFLTKKWQFGPLNGGTAVLVDNSAYWVDAADKVYAANGNAKTWSPIIDYAPKGIDIDSVTSAIGMPPKDYSPSEVDQALKDASDNLEKRMERLKPEIIPVPNYVERLEAIYKNPYNTGRVHSYVRYRSDLMPPNLVITKVKTVEPTGLAALVPLPKPEQPLVKTIREVQVSLTPEGETEYKGINITHVAAVFEHGKVLKKWKQALEKTYVPPKVVFFAVEARRRYLLPDGSWSEGRPAVMAIVPGNQKLPVIPEADGKNFLIIQQKCNELSWIANQEQILESPCPDIVWSNRRTGTWQIQDHKARTRVSDLLKTEEEKSTTSEKTETDARLAREREAARRRGEEAKRQREAAKRREEEAKRRRVVRPNVRGRTERSERRGDEGRNRRSTVRRDERRGDEGRGRIRRPVERDERRGDEGRGRIPAGRDEDRRGDGGRGIRRGEDRRVGLGRRSVTAGPDAPKLVLIPTLQEQLDNPAGILEVWFHDTNLTEGMTYRYQLRLVLINPLLGRFKDVANKDDAKIKFVRTPWSQWSEPVSVKRPTEFFLVGSAPQMGTVTLEVFTQQWGQWISHSFRIGQGEPIGEEVRKELLRLGGGEQEETLVNFKTGAIAVSFNFKKKQRIPGTNFFRTTTELLYLDADGKLRTRTQDDSSQRYKDLRNEVLKSTRTASSVR